MQVFKKYDSEKGRTTPIADVEGHSFGFLADKDAAAIRFAGAHGCAAIPVNTVVYAAGNLLRTFQMVRYGRELLKVSWDGEKKDITINLTTHAAHNDLLTRYDADARWTRL